MNLSERPSRPDALNLLIVDNDRRFIRAASEFAQARGFHTHNVSDLPQAYAIAQEVSFDLGLVDLSLSDSRGSSLLRELDSGQISRVAVVSAEKPSIDSVINALHLPYTDYLLKPLQAEQFNQLLDDVSYEQMMQALRANAHCGALSSHSEAMREIFRQIHRIAPLDTSVLIWAESGSGKELAARAIHELSGRSGPFIAVNCGAVNAELLGSQLFGHERGSFTGAVARHLGWFEQAQGGTLFLDEITEMPLPLQAHLLRVLEDGSFTRIGGAKEQRADVRILSATNRHPNVAIAQGCLREDLYYRLMEFSIHLLPLRERPEDIAYLAEGFVEQLNQRYNAQRYLSPTAYAALRAHRWPGNVRELKNVIHTSFVLAERNAIELHLSEAAERGSVLVAPGADLMTFRIGDSLEDIERGVLQKTLAYYENDKTKTAKTLGVSLKTIYNQLAKYPS